MERTPQNLAIRRRELAMDYKKNMEELADIRKRKAIDIIKLMAEHKTVSKAELYYQATEDGQKEIELTMHSKGLLELMRAVKSELEILNAEAFGNF
jgi:2-keto-3-deoxy-6-phosphogluconate aldolase